MATRSKLTCLRLWQPPRKWLAIIIVSMLCVFVILFVRFNSTPPKGNLSPSDITAEAFPLLGQLPDVSKLWYPAMSGQTPFRPAVFPHNTGAITGKHPRTPLFIGFTRKNEMLVQTLLSYVAAGWPRSDIIVVDNSGTMDANPQALLTHSNPFFLDYKLLRERYGVSILQTPTLLNFAQLQNFFLRTAMAHGWRYYFWSHMDVVVLSDETATPYKSFHDRIIEILSDLGVKSSDMSATKLGNDWGLKYFTYDWLTLINVETWRHIGAWDPFISYYTSDCDAYSRLALHGFTKDDARAGPIFDVASVMSHPETRFFPHDANEVLNSSRFQTLRADLEEMMAAKKLGHRNEWQARHGDGGRGEAWTYDPEGFQKMWWDTADFGKVLYKKKWGSSECRLDEAGLSLKDEWKHLH